MWIESHQDLRSNPKTKRLARALSTSVPAVMGHLHCLWHWALDHADDGDVSQFDAEDLADAAGYDGDAHEFVQALIDCGPGVKVGFLERDGLRGDPADGKAASLVLHDWWEYAGKLVAKRRRDAERKARARAVSDSGPVDTPAPVHGTSSGQAEDGSADGAGTDLTDLTNQPNQPTAASRKRSDRATRLSDDWHPAPEPELVDAIGGQKVAAREFAKFRDHWRAKGGQAGRKVDWQATWRNWLRNCSEFGVKTPTAARPVPPVYEPPPPPPESTPEQRAAAAAERERIRGLLKPVPLEGETG